MVYHNIKPACMLLVKYNDAGSRPCMTWYTLIYCRPLLWEHLLRFGSSSSSRLWSSSLQIVMTTMILFSEEWERVAGYRFPQQSVTPLVARSLDGHTAHFTMCRSPTTLHSSTVPPPTPMPHSSHCWTTHCPRHWQCSATICATLCESNPTTILYSITVHQSTLASGHTAHFHKWPL